MSAAPPPTRVTLDDLDRDELIQLARVYPLVDESALIWAQWRVALDRAMTARDQAFDLYGRIVIAEGAEAVARDAYHGALLALRPQRTLDKAKAALRAAEAACEALRTQRDRLYGKADRLERRADRLLARHKELRG
ncbi:MAG: hypothetical protein M0006_03415 [Magnetospirillum sp.]|nr:hypothetical protein [Magnetospirillum sp.]